VPTHVSSLHREDPIGGSVPGADNDPVNPEDSIGGSVPGADNDRVDPEDPIDGSVPGASDPLEPEDPLGGSAPGADDDDPFAAVLSFAARLYEPPPPISATVARAASGRSFLLMSHSFV
jgi:hypothetical protein